MKTIELKQFTGTTKDARGSIIKTYAVPVLIEGIVVPRSTSESNQAGYENRVISELTLLNFTVDINPKDVVLVDGKAYEVEGESFDWSAWNPFGNFGGRQVALRKVTG